MKEEEKEEWGENESFGTAGQLCQLVTKVNGKGCGRKRSWPTLTYYLSIVKKDFQRGATNSDKQKCNYIDSWQDRCSFHVYPTLNHKGELDHFLTKATSVQGSSRPIEFTRNAPGPSRGFSRPYAASPTAANGRETECRGSLCLSTAEQSLRS